MKRKTSNKIIDVLGKDAIALLRLRLFKGDLKTVSLRCRCSHATVIRTSFGETSRIDIWKEIEKVVNERQLTKDIILTGCVSVNEIDRMKGLFKLLVKRNDFKLYCEWKGKKFTGMLPAWFTANCLEEYIVFVCKRPKKVKEEIVFDSGDLTSTVVKLESEVSRLKGILFSFGLE